MEFGKRTELMKYTSGEDMLAWLAHPRNGDQGDAWVADILLDEMDEYVKDMELHLHDHTDGSPLKAAKQVFVDRIVEDGVSVTDDCAVRRSAAAKAAELKKEQARVEAVLQYRLSTIVEREFRNRASGLKGSSEQALRTEACKRLRAKVHRLIELPLWIKVACHLAQPAPTAV
ncbi:hypothetical protein DIPPA_02917 [Diplonema papillatum]|nr:hypothetical protein DIPPA_02917 [Diplonema papillatum]|eukprot:gene8186-12620_t